MVLSLFVYGFWQADMSTLKTAAYAWVLSNGVFSGLGTIAALGHPLTVMTAFVAAPLTSLNPTVGAGMATALVQAMVAPPTVADLEGLGEDLVEWRGWWRNRLGRLALVFLFSSVGSTLGTFIAFGWLKNLL
jgi:pheromone shutdown protein TraB